MKLAKEGSRQAASSFYPWTRRNWARCSMLLVLDHRERGGFHPAFTPSALLALSLQPRLCVADFAASTTCGSLWDPGDAKVIHYDPLRVPPPWSTPSDTLDSPGTCWGWPRAGRWSLNQVCLAWADVCLELPNIPLFNFYPVCMCEGLHFPHDAFHESHRFATGVAAATINSLQRSRRYRTVTITIAKRMSTEFKDPCLSVSIILTNERFDGWMGERVCKKALLNFNTRQIGVNFHLHFVLE
ncbi:hypothetical protein KQX54_004436 [Cotesia glomerata]|uniref:Uncharacterized protein n=1 Tax=Cotesia glomerata TaxID=32391 RepID=A0AAV7I435_COTGL|nr:hypothetical protein KQX54_004436 [Cotesia glomerata]